MEVDNVDTPGQEVAGSSSQDGTMDNNHKWLQECMVSLSPANDLLAVGYEDRIVLLSRKYLIISLSWKPVSGNLDLKLCSTCHQRPNRHIGTGIKYKK